MAVKNPTTTDSSEELVDNYTKKDVIINAWFLTPDITPSELYNDLSDRMEISLAHVQNILSNEIRDKKLSDDTLRETTSHPLQVMLQNVLNKDCELNFTVPERNPYANVTNREVGNGAKKEIVINTWFLTQTDIEIQAAADIADCSWSYAYLTIKDLEEGKLLNNVNDWLNPELQTEILKDVSETNN